MMQSTHSTRSLKEKQRAEREALILQVAEDVLMEKGYYETSIDEIAARVGIAKGTVYLHFPGKDDLVMAIFSRNVDGFLAQARQAIDPLSTPREKLEQLLYCMYNGIHRKNTNMLYSAFNSAEMQHFFQTTEEKLRPLSTWVMNLLEEGKATGAFDASIPTSVMHATFFSLVSPKSYQRLTVEEHMSPDELAQHMAHLYFQGIAAHA